MASAASDIHSIFNQALEQESAAQLLQFLDQACAGEPDLRQRVEALLRAHSAAGDFLGGTPPIMAATEDAQAAHSSTGQAAVFPIQPGTQIGPYKLREQLAEGGMGMVYVAEQTAPMRRKVALKIIKPGLSSRDVVARFEAERQALALMDHPHIARVIDGGVTEWGQPYFVMELVQGLPITQYCDEHRLETTKRLQLFIKVCRAVQHAHQKGVIHRDLKPSNVLVAEIDDEAVPKVIDFGIAKAMHQKLSEQTIYTHFAQMVGTPLYMSPEQVALGVVDVDTRSDVYSLGTMLYEILTGHTPFDRAALKAAGFDEMRRIIREQDPPRPSALISTLNAAALSTVAERRQKDPRKLGESLAGELDWIVMKALEKDRNRRYESASDLARDVERYLADEPVTACPPSIAYRFHKYIRRHSAKLTVFLLLLATVMAGAAASMSQAIRATRAQKLADANAQRALGEKLKAVEEANKAREAAQREFAARQSEKKERERAVANEQRSLELAYFADLRSGMGDWLSGNVARLTRNLMRHLPQLSAQDLRGWEWYYLLSLCHREDRTFTHHQASVTHVAWSPDGRYLASVSQDGNLAMLDTASWQLRGRWQGETNMLAHGLSWSPDSRYVAWGKVAKDNGAYILDSATQETQRLAGHTDSVWTVAWSSDGKYLASAGMDRTIRIWEPATSRCIRVLNRLGSSSSYVTSLAWHPSQPLLFSAARREGVSIWDTRTGELTSTDYTISAESSDVSPAGRELAVGTQGGELIIYNAKDLSVLLRWQAHSGTVKGVAWDPSGTRLLSGGADHLVKIWDCTNGENLLTLAGHLNQVKGVDWHPDGQQIASAGADGLVKIWSVPMVIQPLRLPASEPIRDFAWCEDEKTLRTYSVGSVSVWNTDSGECLQTLEAPIGEKVAFSGDGSLLVILPMDDGQNEGGILDLESRDWFPLQVNWPNRAKAASYSPDARQLAVYGDQQLHVINWRDNFVSLEKSDFAQIAQVSWSPAGGTLAVVGNGQVGDDGYSQRAAWLYGINVDEHQHQNWRVRHGENRVMATSIAWRPDGSMLVSGDTTGLVEIREANSQRRLASVQLHTVRVSALDWSPDGRRIASAGDDGTVVVCDAVRGEELIRFSVADQRPSRLRWSPDGQRLAVLADSVISIWDATRGYAYAHSEDFALTVLKHELATAEQEWALGHTDVAKERLQTMLGNHDAIPADGAALLAASKLIAKFSGSDNDSVDPVRWLNNLVPMDDQDTDLRYEILNEQALIYYRQQRFAEALTILREAQSIPDLSDAYSNVLNHNLGFTLANLGRLNEATAAIEQAVHFQDSTAERIALAFLYCALDRHKDYREVCDKLLENLLTTDDPVYAKQLTWACVLSVQALDDYSEVTALARKFTHEYPRDSGSHRDFSVASAGLLFRAGHFEDALPELLEQANGEWETQYATPAHVFCLLAMTHSQLGQHREAREWLERADSAASNQLNTSDSLWQRKLSLKLFRDEAHAMVHAQSADRTTSNSSSASR